MVEAGIKKLIYIVIAAYNEAEKIGSVVAAVRDVYPNVVVIDDGSTDETAARAAQAGAVTIRHILNRGQGAALQTGIEYCLRHNAQYIVTFDGDEQHRVEDIAVLLEPIINGDCDVALGSRFLQDDHSVPLFRKVLLKGAVLFTRLTTGVKFSDAHNGLRAFNRLAASRITISLDGMAHASEIIDHIIQYHLRFKELPVRISYSRYSLRKGQKPGDALHVMVDYLLKRVLK